MAHTVQEVLDQATERSNLNDSSLIPEAQLLDYVTSLERRAFLLAAKENPDFLGREGSTASRADETSAWDLTSTPGNVAAVSRLEVSSITGTVSGVSTGDEVNVISIRAPENALSPRVYIRDRKVRQWSDELGADGSNFVDTLKVYYSFLSPDRTATSDTLDLPAEFNDMIVVPLAAILAHRDQRPEEAQVLNQEYTQIIVPTFLQQVSVFDEVAIRDLDEIQAASNSLGLNNAE